MDILISNTGINSIKIFIFFITYGDPSDLFYVMLDMLTYGRDFFN